MKPDEIPAEEAARTTAMKKKGSRKGTVPQKRLKTSGLHKGVTIIMCCNMLIARVLRKTHHFFVERLHF
jgi:hypothetical protein